MVEVDLDAVGVEDYSGYHEWGYGCCVQVGAIERWEIEEFRIGVDKLLESFFEEWKVRIEELVFFGVRDWKAHASKLWLGGLVVCELFDPLSNADSDFVENGEETQEGREL